MKHYIARVLLVLTKILLSILIAHSSVLFMCCVDMLFSDVMFRLGLVSKALLSSSSFPVYLLLFQYSWYVVWWHGGAEGSIASSQLQGFLFSLKLGILSVWCFKDSSKEIAAKEKNQDIEIEKSKHTILGFQLSLLFCIISIWNRGVPYILHNSVIVTIALKTNSVLHLYLNYMMNIISNGLLLLLSEYGSESLLSPYSIYWIDLTSTHWLL